MPGIRFKLEIHSYDNANYLDCTVFKFEGNLVTKAYFKPSDTHAYMSPNSCHATHIAKNIPRGAAIRCRRLNTLDSDFDLTAKMLIAKFVERGYKESFVTEEFNKARLLDRITLIHKETTIPDSKIQDIQPTLKNNRCFPLVTTYNPQLPNISKYLQKHKPFYPFMSSFL